MAIPGKMARRILVVDDEEAVCETIKMVLALDQHEVTTANSSQKGLATFQNSPFDLVITDYQMPNMNGDKLAAAIRALVPGQKILMVTAYGESLRAAGEFPLPVDLVMSKPFSVQELRDSVLQLTAAT
jgi:CheY-like chemotaxis protein